VCVCYYHLYFLHGQLKKMKVSTLSALNQFFQEGKHFLLCGGQLGIDTMLVKLFFVLCLAAAFVKANRRDHRGGMNRYRLEGLEEQTFVNDTKIIMIVNNTLVSTGDQPVRGPPVTRTRSTTTTAVPKTNPTTTTTPSPDFDDDTATPSVKEGSVAGMSFLFILPARVRIPVGEALNN